jgi:hypothetical protein
MSQHGQFLIVHYRLTVTTLTMADNDQVTKWIAFTPAEITTRFRAQGVGTIGLWQFFAAKMARLSAGCASDGQGMKETTSGFHLVWQRDSGVHVQTRANGLHVFNDLVRVRFGVV